MNVECKDAEGFEDQLKNHQTYEVLKTGVNGYLIENDKNQERWYGFYRFSVEP